MDKVNKVVGFKPLANQKILIEPNGTVWDVVEEGVFQGKDWYRVERESKSTGLTVEDTLIEGQQLFTTAYRTNR